MASQSKSHYRRLRKERDLVDMLLTSCYGLPRTRLLMINATTCEFPDLAVSGQKTSEVHAYYVAYNKWGEFILHLRKLGQG